MNETSTVILSNKTNRMTFQLGNILLLRCKQFFRIFCRLGVIRAFVVLGVIAFSIAAVYKLIAAEKNIHLIAAGYWLLLLVIHLRRKDKNFLKINIPSFRAVYAVEYMVLSIPLIISVLLCGNRWVSGYIAVGILFISLIDHNRKILHKTFNTNLQKLIPSDLYEWKAGVRKNLILLFTVYGLGVCLSLFVAAIPVAMVITGLIISDFFAANESWQMLLSFEKSAKKMLLYKMKRHSLLYAIGSFPLVILFVLFHPDFWYIPLIAFIALLSIHIYMITVKFARYEMDGKSSISPVLQFIGIGFGLIPVMTPFLWLFSVFFFQRACINLKPVLHDFD